MMFMAQFASYLSTDPAMGRHYLVRFILLDCAKLMMVRSNIFAQDWSADSRIYSRTRSGCSPGVRLHVKELSAARR